MYDQFISCWFWKCRWLDLNFFGWYWRFVVYLAKGAQILSTFIYMRCTLYTHTHLWANIELVAVVRVFFLHRFHVDRFCCCARCIFFFTNFTKCTKKWRCSSNFGPYFAYLNKIKFILLLFPCVYSIHVFGMLRGFGPSTWSTNDFIYKWRWASGLLDIKWILDIFMFCNIHLYMVVCYFPLF